MDRRCHRLRRLLSRRRQHWLLLIHHGGCHGRDDRLGGRRRWIFYLDKQRLPLILDHHQLGLILPSNVPRRMSQEQSTQVHQADGRNDPVSHDELGMRLETRHAGQQHQAHPQDDVEADGELLHGCAARLGAREEVKEGHNNEGATRKAENVDVLFSGQRCPSSSH